MHVSVHKQDTFLPSFQSGPSPLCHSSQRLAAWSITPGVGRGIAPASHLRDQLHNFASIAKDRHVPGAMATISKESLWHLVKGQTLSLCRQGSHRVLLSSSFSHRAAVSYSSPMGSCYTVPKAAALRGVTCHYLGYESGLLIKPLKPGEGLGREVGSGQRRAGGSLCGSGWISYHSPFPGCDIAVPRGTNPPRFVHGSGPALPSSGAELLLQTVCSALSQAPRAPYLQRGQRQTIAAAPRSNLNAVTLGELGKVFY